MPDLTVNGKAHSFTPGEFPATLAALVANLGLPPRGLVAELDHEVVPPSEFATRALQPGDRVELVQLVGGG